MKFKYAFLLFSCLTLTFGYAMAEPSPKKVLNNDVLVKQLTTQKHDICSLAIASPGDKHAVIVTKSDGQFFLRGPSGSEYKQMSLPVNPEAEITTTAFSPDGKWLVFGTNFGLTRLYKVSTLWDKNGNGAGKGVLLGHQHNDQVNAVAFSPDAKMFASGGADRILLVSSLKSSAYGNLTQDANLIAKVLSGSIKVLTFSSDGKTLAVGTADGTISLVDVVNRNVKKTYPNDWAMTALAFSPDGKTLASGIEDGKMVVRNTLSSKELISQPKAHAYKINVLMFSPDGKMLASGGPDRKVRLWNTQSGKKVGEAIYEREVLSVIFSADGQELTVGDRSGRIARSKTSEVMDAKPQQTQPLVAQQNRQNTSPRVSRFQNRSQKKQNSSDRNSKPAALYDKIEALNSKPVYTVTFVPSDDNRPYLLGQRDSFILSFPDTPIQLPHGSVGNAVSAAFSPSIGYAIARSNDSTAWLVDPSGKFKKPNGLGHDFNVNVVAFSPDRITLAVGTANGVFLWNVSKADQLPENQQPKAPGPNKALAFSPDRRMLAIGKTNGVIQLWDLSDNTNLRNLTLGTSNNGIKALAFSPDSKTLAVARLRSGEIERWNIPNSQKLRRSLKTTEMSSLKLDTLVGHTNMVNTVKFSPDGKTLASGDSSGKVLFWDVQTDAEIDPIQHYNTKYPQSKDKYIGHEDAVLSVAFSDDGNTLKSGDATGVILLWNLSTIDITSNPNQILAYNEQQKIVQNADRQKAETSDQDSKQNTATETVTRKPVPQTATRDDTEIEIPKDTDPQLPATSDSSIVLDEFDSSVKANVSSYVLSGKVDAKNGPFKVKINDTDAEMLQDGQHFEGSIKLNEGANPIIIVATDKNGKSWRRNIEIDRKPKPDKIGPAIDPDYKSTVGRTVRTTVIKGTVEDDKSGIAKVEINGKEAKIEFSLTTDRLIGSFQKQVTLDEGDNQFTITATDNSTKKTEETITIRREPTPPVIKVINPQLDTSTNSAKIWKSTLKIKVEVTDESGVAEVKSDGGLGPTSMSLDSRLNNGGVYTSTYNYLSAGQRFDFAITAKDTKGGTARKQIAINFAKDEIKPIISPSVASPVNRKTVYIRAEVTDAQTGIKNVKLVKPDGQEVPLTPNRNGEISHLVKLREGDNIFKIFATDEMNNTAKEEIPIRRVPTPPSIEILSPRLDGATDTATISQNRFEVTVRVTDEESGIKSVKIDGQNATTQDGIIFKRIVNFPTPGLNTIKIEAEDTAGGKDDKSFNLDFQKPKPPVSQPSTPVNETGPSDVSTTLPDTTPNRKKEKNPPDVTFSNPDLRYERPCEVSEDEFLLTFKVFDESELPDKVEIERIERAVDKWKSELVKYADRIDKSAEFEFKYEARLPLHEGQNRFEMTVRDQWNNRTFKEFTIVKRQIDNQGPEIHISEMVGSNGQPISFTGNAIQVAGEEISLRGTVSDRSGVKSLEVNGELIRFADDGKFEKKLFLNYAKNEIIIKAIDEKGMPNESKLEITQQFDRTNKDFALFFAIDTYSGKKDKNDNWRNLQGPIRDAKAVAENLQDNYGFQTKIYENLTRRELLDTIYKYRESFDGIKYTEGSQLLLFFSGHGHYNREERVGYLIAADTDSPIIDPALGSALPHDKLRNQIELIKCPRLLVLLDTCESGTFDPNYEPLAETKGLFDEMEDLKIIKKKLAFEARWCMTASGIEKVLDSDENLSPFAKAFLDALDTKGGDDFLLTLDEVWKEIQKSKDHPVYDKFIQSMEESGQDFKRPEPRKGQFGKTHLPESDFLFLPKEIE